VNVPSSSATPHRLIAALLCFAVACLEVSTALAADTRWWTSSTSRDYGEAESRGVVIDPDGGITLGPAASSSPIDSLGVIWAAAVLPDGSVALAGDHGRIVRWTRGRGARPWVTLPVGQVLSLSADGDGVVAGTGPEGLVYRIRAGGDTTRIASTGERYVWALAPAGEGAWYAGTGPEGRIVRIGRDGRVRIGLDTEEKNIVSLVADGHGGAIGGGDTQGRVVQVGADGRARTLYDAEEDEIRALARGEDGAVYAAALRSKAVQGADGEDPEATPRPTRRPSSREAARVYRIVPDSAAAIWWSSPRPVIFALAPVPGGVVAATGHRAGLYLLDGPGRASQWLAAPEAQVTALARAADGTFYAATSNPAVLWEVRPGAGREGELRSGVLDAQRVARFGGLAWQGDAGGGRVTLEARSGNSEEPDTTWSEWASGRGGGAAPPARYFQWRLRLEGGRPAIRSVEVPYREINLAPVVAGVRFTDAIEGFREGRLSARTEPVTQELSDGRKVEFSLKRRPEDNEIRSLPLWAQGLRSVHWTAEDANDDPLTYRVEAQRAGEDAWLPVAKDLGDSVYVWDTQGVPDGTYRLRVTASDAEGNAVGEGREGTAVSGLIVVDHTAPRIGAFDASGGPGRITLRGEATDSPGLHFEVAVDDGAWRTLTPQGGFADAERASFSATLEDVAPGVHAVTLRVSDRAGNFSVRATRVTVTR